MHVCILQMFFKCVNFKSLSNLLQIFFKCLQIVFLYKDQRQTQSLSRCLLTDKHLHWYLAFLCWAIVCCKTCQLQDKGEHGQIMEDLGRSSKISLIFQDLPIFIVFKDVEHGLLFPFIIFPFFRSSPFRLLFHQCVILWSRDNG